jgi:hypothetical protein
MNSVLEPKGLILTDWTQFLAPSGYLVLKQRGFACLHPELTKMRGIKQRSVGKSSEFWRSDFTQAASNLGFGDPQNVSFAACMMKDKIP